LDIEQKTLRELAADVLTKHGFEVQEAVKGTGGARLKVMKGGEVALALVRTSTDRWVGWMRDDAGALKGLDDADIVVVAALDGSDEPTTVEVMAFEPDVVREAFEANIAARKDHGKGLSPSAPVFICLDETRKEKPAAVSSDFKRLAIWTETISVATEDLVDDEAEEEAFADDDGADDFGKFDLEGFLEKVKAELAARLNVPSKAISLELRVQL
jgi:hypothetical protein